MHLSSPLKYSVICLFTPFLQCWVPQGSQAFPET